MHVINHRQHRKTARGRNQKMRQILLWVGVSLGVFIVANLAMLAMYHNKALPKYAVGSLDIGGKSFTQIDAALQSSTLPESITLTKDQQSQKVPVADLGITVDKAKTTSAVKHTPPLPILSLVMHHTVPLVLNSDAQKAASSLTAYDAVFSKASTNRHIAFETDKFVIKDAAAGYGFDEDATATKAFRAVADGKTSVKVTVKTLPAGDNSADLAEQLSVVQKQLQTKVTFTYGTQKMQPTAAEMGSWYAPDGATMAVSDTGTTAYLDSLATKFGITVANKTDLMTAMRYVLGKNLSSNFRISAATTSTTRTYCTAVNGVPAAELNDLVGKLAATYADLRGWNNGGKIAFKHVDTGCDYRVVIAAPGLMTSYGSICDNYYNCQVGNNVIVNNDRWLYATEPWNKTGQNLETYRLLIINHETGHRLGFRDYNVCAGPGQPAPVMMQQSIDLMGCAFNVWPLQSELDKL